DVGARRRDFYEAGQEDLLDGFVADALRLGSRVEDGHHACRRYVMEPQLARVTSPATVVSGTADHYATPSLEPMADHFGTQVHLIDGHVPLPEQNPTDFARLVADAMAAARVER